MQRSAAFARFGFAERQERVVEIGRSLGGGARPLLDGRNAHTSLAVDGELFPRDELHDVVSHGA